MLSNANNIRSCPILICLLLAVGISGCDWSTTVERKQSLNAGGEFGVFWPPRDVERPLGDADVPLLRGELSVLVSESDEPNVFRLQVVLRRPHGEDDRVHWNESLAFPEYSWMAQVRVWDHDDKWLWPNLPYLLRAHGRERIERYGGVDPGKGVDNDFAAVLIRPIDARQGSSSIPPLVSAEWHGADASGEDKYSIVHVARSDEFGVRVTPSDDAPQSGKLGVWLIYADFLDAGMPRNWPQEEEYAGGILAYLEVCWQRTSDGRFEFDIEHLVPPSGTGFDWEDWSTGESALKKNLEMDFPLE